MASQDSSSDSMSNLRSRLCSFKKFPSIYELSNIIFVKLSEMGFYYTGHNKDLICYFCKRQWNNWNDISADVIDDHLIHSPDCSNMDSSNNGSTLANHGVPETAHRFSNNVHTSQERAITSQRMNNNTVESRPRHPRLQSGEARLDSFPADWREVCPIPHRHLAAAGLFYIGPDDRVECFYCGGKLHTWQPGEDPWEEHKRWFPNCQFFRMTINVAQKMTHGEGVMRNASNNELPNNFELPDPNLLTRRTIRTTRADSLQWNILTEQYKEIIALRKANTDLQKDLAEKEEELRGPAKCFVCSINNRCVVMPCKHYIICNECVSRLNNKCPTCRQNINNVIDIFHS